MFRSENRLKLAQVRSGRICVQAAVHEMRQQALPSLKPDPPGASVLVLCCHEIIWDDCYGKLAATLLMQQGELVAELLA
jgi:hypothetical protein